MDSFVSQVGHWIRQNRKTKGWGQVDVGIQVGVSQAMVSMWERGVSSPSDEQMGELRKIFDQPVAQKAVAQVPASESKVAQSTTPRKSRKSTKPETNGNIGFENKLWAAADLLRSNMDAAEYKHVVLGLLFLKYVSDAFQERSEILADMVREPESEYHVEGPDAQDEEIRAILRDRDEFISANVFWVPEKARWSYLQAHAKQPEIGRTYHAWRGEEKDGTYEDIPGFCQSFHLDEIRSHHYCSPPAATSEPKRSRMMASHTRKRCPNYPIAYTRKCAGRANWVP